MSENLPVEVVAYIFRAAAEDTFWTDIRTALNIVESCTIGYLSAIPVIYHTISINDSSELIERIFRTDVRGTGVLSRTPAERLCPLVKTLYVYDSEFSTPELILQLSNLATLYCYDALNLEQHPQSLRHYHALQFYPDHMPPTSVSHLSFYLSFNNGEEKDVLRHSDTFLPHTVTHAAVELNERLDASDERRVRKLIRYLLSRNTTAPVFLRLYGFANEQFSHKVVYCAIHGLDTLEDRQRVLLWLDTRPVVPPTGDTDLSRRDAYNGTTPWTEGLAVSEEELQAAVKELGMPQFI